jgi:hypothetical protein
LGIFILNLVDGVWCDFSPTLLAALTAFCKLLVNTGCSKLIYSFFGLPVTALDFLDLALGLALVLTALDLLYLAA